MFPARSQLVVDDPFKVDWRLSPAQKDTIDQVGSDRPGERIVSFITILRRDSKTLRCRSKLI